MTGRRRTVLIGAGNIGAKFSEDPLVRRYFRYATHADVLAAHPAYEWGGCVDTDASALSYAMKKWNLPHGAHSIAELVKSYEPEVLILAIPPSGRLEILRSYAGVKAALCEKPLGVDRDAALEFLNFCDQRKIRVQVNYWRRFDALLRRLAEGELAAVVGKPQVIHGIYGNGLLNNGSHLVDMCRMLFGEVISVRVLSEPIAVPAVHDFDDFDVAFALRFAGGAAAMLQTVDFRAYREVGLDSWGDKGRLEIWNEGLTIHAYARGAHRALSDASELILDRPAALTPTIGEALFAAYDNLAAALNQDAPLLSSGDSAWRTAAVVDEISSAARAGDTGERTVDYRRVTRR